MNQKIFSLLFLLCFLNFKLLSAHPVEAKLESTDPASSISGTVQFEETEQGVKIIAEIKNAPVGKHGFHIHEKGDCSDKGNAAGSHFNPDKVSHGDVTKDGKEHAHAGDFGNIEIGENGEGKLEKTLPHLTLDLDHYGVLGRSVILHEKEDDFGQPTGNAGGRIACGIIKAK